MANTKVNWGLTALAGGTGAGWLWGRSKKKSDQPAFEFQPYSGLRPPRIDANGKEYLRPTQDLTQKTVMDRSQGIGVGYDPERRQLLTELVKSQLGQQEEDQLRSAQGQISASGLSGNPRAYEALAGRVKRDTGRQLGDSLSKIAIEDLGRANEERDINTARLFDLNRFNFGQENDAANFDLDVYNAEQGNRLGAANFNQGVSQFDQSRQDELLSDLGGLALGGASLAMGNPAPLIMAGASQAGKGIAPSYSGYGTKEYIGSNAGYRKNYRNLVR